MEEKKIIYAEVHHQVEDDSYVTSNNKLEVGQAVFVRKGNTNAYNKIYINLGNSSQEISAIEPFVLLTEDDLGTLNNDEFESAASNIIPIWDAVKRSFVPSGKTTEDFVPIDAEFGGFLPRYVFGLDHQNKVQRIPVGNTIEAFANGATPIPAYFSGTDTTTQNPPANVHLWTSDPKQAYHAVSKHYLDTYYYTKEKIDDLGLSYDENALYTNKPLYTRTEKIYDFSTYEYVSNPLAINSKVTKIDFSLLTEAIAAVWKNSSATHQIQSIQCNFSSFAIYFNDGSKIISDSSTNTLKYTSDEDNVLFSIESNGTINGSSIFDVDTYITAIERLSSPIFTCLDIVATFVDTIGGGTTTENTYIGNETIQLGCFIDLLVATEDYVNDKIAEIDTSEIDLSNYYTKDETNDLIGSLLDAIHTEAETIINS